jgi:hypothetical protein
VGTGCVQLFTRLGVRPENLLVYDKAGLVHPDRNDLFPYQRAYAREDAAFGNFEKMNMGYTAKALRVAAFVLPAWAADRPASFPEAAKLHRAGDTAAAMAIWLPLAKGGDVNAAYNLAVIHQYGDGVPKNLPQALKWYRVAAERGDRESQSRLGAMYLNGEGTAKNEKEGWRWINEHRVAHLHHDHHPQMQAWRKQAAELIAERDMREAALASRRTSPRRSRHLMLSREAPPWRRSSSSSTRCATPAGSGLSASSCCRRAAAFSRWKRRPASRFRGGRCEGGGRRRWR